MGVLGEWGGQIKALNLCNGNQPHREVEMWEETWKMVFLAEKRIEQNLRQKFAYNICPKRRMSVWLEPGNMVLKRSEILRWNLRHGVDSCWALKKVLRPSDFTLSKIEFRVFNIVHFCSVIFIMLLIHSYTHSSSICMCPRLKDWEERRIRIISKFE